MEKKYKITVKPIILKNKKSYAIYNKVTYKRHSTQFKSFVNNFVTPHSKSEYILHDVSEKFGIIFDFEKYLVKKYIDKFCDHPNFNIKGIGSAVKFYFLNLDFSGFNSYDFFNHLIYGADPPSILDCFLSSQDFQ